MWALGELAVAELVMLGSSPLVFRELPLHPDAYQIVQSVPVCSVGCSEEERHCAF